MHRVKIETSLGFLNNVSVTTVNREMMMRYHAVHARSIKSNLAATQACLISPNCGFSAEGNYQAR